MITKSLSQTLYHIYVIFLPDPDREIWVPLREIGDSDKNIPYFCQKFDTFSQGEVIKYERITNFQFYWYKTSTVCHYHYNNYRMFR